MSLEVEKQRFIAIKEQQVENGGKTDDLQLFSTSILQILMKIS